MSFATKTRWLIICLALFVIASRAVAADPPKPTVDPAAQKVLDAFGAYMKGLGGFRVNVVSTIEQAGRKQELKEQIVAKRPNLMAVMLEAPGEKFRIVNDGAAISATGPDPEKYGAEKSPATWNAMLENNFVAGMLNAGCTGMPFASALFSDDPARELISSSAAVKYQGLVNLEGQRCHELTLVQQPFNWRIWIAEGDQPRLVKAFAELPPQAEASLIISFSEWESDPKFPADTFTFTPPAGAKKVNSLIELVSDDEPSGPSPLLGRPAPPIQLAQLDGSPFDLAALKDKNIVILDFWATWCGPCVQAMPIIDKVAEQYREKGVRLYAVNIQEGPDLIKNFLSETKLKVQVLLDKEGAVAKAYLVQGIPQTVIIGKDGAVQVVHIGMSDKLEEQLSGELDALVAGKDLAGEALAKAREKAEK